jgi:hypothetical protein
MRRGLVRAVTTAGDEVVDDDGDDGQAGAVEHQLRPGDRMFIACDGGPSISRLEKFPPPLEIEEHHGVYVLHDDGPPEQWRYEFVPHTV